MGLKSGHPRPQVLSAAPAHPAPVSTSPPPPPPSGAEGGARPGGSFSGSSRGGSGVHLPLPPSQAPSQVCGWQLSVSGGCLLGEEGVRFLA
jgi:hypothetical protein